MGKQFDFSACHPEWKAMLETAVEKMDKSYIDKLLAATDWLPGLDTVFAAFSLPLSQTQYVLFGESPYPRSQSANGYAFWDNAVGSLWSPQGFSKPVNRATSLRNWLKMLLVARGSLNSDTSQQAIAQIDNSALVQTAEDFFGGMMNKGILLLNACLIYEEGKIPYHARHWKPFMQSLLEQLAEIKPEVQLILLGKIAEAVPQDKLPVGLAVEHPYNVSFITNQAVIEFFQPLDLLSYA
ncbi:uracil-DNA glycosylase family protein [Legionella shakespearei]|nr:uracil-DNA glycosylase family protein [Legionella shakespearei]